MEAWNRLQNEWRFSLKSIKGLDILPLNKYAQNNKVLDISIKFTCICGDWKKSKNPP